MRRKVTEIRGFGTLGMQCFATSAAAPCRMHTELRVAEAMIRIKGPQRSVTCQAFVQSHISRLQVGEP